MEITAIRHRFLFASESYLLRGEGGAVLVDTGLSRTRGQLLRGLADAGCDPAELTLVVLTHAHTDHAGSCRYLQAEHGVPIAMHAADIEKVRRGDMFWDPEGTHAVAGAVIKTLLAPFGMGRFQPFEPDVLLEEGQDLGDWGLVATVVHLPGHSPGSIGVLTATGELFCGDLLTSTKGPTRNKIVDEPAAYAASVERLRELEVETVYPGHGTPFRIEELWRAERAASG